ncbi:hypothetical protein ACSNOI_45710 [Actinomadura kijaniata]|uniref:hypothetical protein n=1 Tax=Actinomadura kijaniata TaxID=46161 RepID=UPI003F1938DD
MRHKQRPSLVGVVAAAAQDVVAGPVQVGGAWGPADRVDVAAVITQGAQWLVAHHQRWESYVEDDKDVQGTAWAHMAYALGVQAAIRGGYSPLDARLARAWRLLGALWDAEAGLWAEPGPCGRDRATIRAAYYTVGAYRAARDRLAELHLGQDVALAAAATGPAPATVVWVQVGDGGRRVQVVTKDGRVHDCELPDRLAQLAAVLAAAGPAGASTRRIGEAMFLSARSVPKYVQRINQALAVDGHRLRIVRAQRVAGQPGYALVLDEPPTA